MADIRQPLAREVGSQLIGRPLRRRARCRSLRFAVVSSRQSIRLDVGPAAKAQLKAFEVLFKVSVILQSDTVSCEERYPIFLSTITLAGQLGCLAPVLLLCVSAASIKLAL